MCSFLRFLFLEFQGLICSCFRMLTVVELYEAVLTGSITDYHYYDFVNVTFCIPTITPILRIDY